MSEELRIEVPEGVYLLILRAPEGWTAEQAIDLAGELSETLKLARGTGRPVVLALPRGFSLADDVRVYVGGPRS
jgi:hypothetical protein